MSDTTPPRDLPQAEWKFIASRINDIVLHLDPQLSMNTYGDDPTLRGRLDTIYGMHIEHVCALQSVDYLRSKGSTGTAQATERVHGNRGA